MKQKEHLCILRCVGNLDIWGSALGNGFIQDMNRRKLLVDMNSAVSKYLANRDGFLILSGLECEYQGIIQEKFTLSKELKFSSIEKKELITIIESISFAS